MFRQRGHEYPIIVRLREEDQRQACPTSSDVLVSTPQGQVVQAKNLMTVDARIRSAVRSSARTSSASPTSTPSPKRP